MAYFYIGLLSVISLAILCDSQRYPTCAPEDIRNLFYGQTFYALNDSTGGDPNLALRNMTQHRIHPEYVAGIGIDNVNFTISVPNIFRGVEMRRITMLTRNVARLIVEVTIESEIETDEQGQLEVFVGGVGELVVDIPPLKKYQRSTFEVPGDIAHVKISFYRGEKGRMRVQKLFINGCAGKAQN